MPNKSLSNEARSLYLLLLPPSILASILALNPAKLDSKSKSSSKSKLEDKSRDLLVGAVVVAVPIEVAIYAYILATFDIRDIEEYIVASAIVIFSLTTRAIRYS